MKATYRKIRVFGTIFIFYGILNLVTYSNYQDFARVSNGLPALLVRFLFCFGIAYGVVGVLCGTRILRLEEWARRTALIFVAFSLVSGIFVAPVTIGNMKKMFEALPQPVTASVSDMLNAYVFIAGIFTFFELLFVYFFTRQDTGHYFKQRD